jgi:hypothetical protein
LDNPDSCVMSHEDLHDSRSTSAIIASYWLVSMVRVDELHAQVRRIYTCSCLKDTLFQSSKEIPDDIDRDNVAHITLKKF